MKCKRLFAALGAAVITLSAVTTVSAQKTPGDTYINLGQANISIQGQQRPQANEGSIAGGPEATCVKVVTNPTINGTSTNGRAPTTNFQYIRTHYLITAAELATAGYTNGASPTIIGWVYSTANNGATAPLKVYMENTADTTNLKSATWATAISTMTLVHDASVTLPAVVGPVDITMSGGSPFTYTGGGIYVAFDWGQYPLATTATAVISCNTNLVGGLLGAQSNVAAPTAGLAASNFRPITRLNGVSLLNEAAVTNVQAYGALPGCAVGPQVVRAVVTNNGENTLTNLSVTLNVTGANTFNNVQVVPSVAGCGGTAVVTFASYSATNAGTDTVTVSIPADTNTANDTLARTTSIGQFEYSYKYPGSATAGGVGVAGATAILAAKFNTTVADTITDVKLEWQATAPASTIYRIEIYGDNAGVPSLTTLYADAADRTIAANGPVTITLPAPVPVGPGNFYIAVKQTTTVNYGLGFDNETPIRSGSFFFYIGTFPPTAWTDFAPGTNFKPNIGYLGTACSAPPVCLGNTNADTVVDVLDLLAVINGWGNCTPPCPPTPCPADVAVPTNCVVDVVDLLSVINHWGACP